MGAGAATRRRSINIDVPFAAIAAQSLARLSLARSCWSNLSKCLQMTWPAPRSLHAAGTPLKSALAPPRWAWRDAVERFRWIGFVDIATMLGLCTLSDLSLVLVIAFAGLSLLALVDERVQGRIVAWG